MKTKLLKKLRKIGRNQIDIWAISTTNELTTGMNYAHPGENYRNLFCIGDTESDVKNKAYKIWLTMNIEQIRRKYRRYTRKWKTNL